MARDWRHVPFGEICDHSAFGPRFSSEEYAIDGNVACLRTTDIASDGRIDFDAMPIAKLDLDKLRSHILQRDDLVITRTGAYLGKVAVFSDFRLPVLTGAFSIRFRLNRRVADPQFIRYFFGSQEGQSAIQSIATGSVQPNLNITNLHTLSVPVPPIVEQRKIVAILGALDDKIELNRRMNETLEGMSRALFKSWFVDFDAVRAKLDGRLPPNLDPATAALFPDHFEHTESGLRPRDWRIDSIYEIADVVYGAPFASSQFNADRIGRPLIRIRDLVDENPEVWTPEIHPKGQLIRPGDIVVGMDGEFRAYIWGGTEAWLNQRVCIFVPKPGYSPAFVRNSVIEPLMQVESTETATTVIHLGKSDIDRFKVIVPSAKVIQQFNQICQPWYDRIVAGKQQSRTFAALRDALLPKLLSGEIRVPTAEKLVEKVE